MANCLFIFFCISLDPSWWMLVYCNPCRGTNALFEGSIIICYYVVLDACIDLLPQDFWDWSWEELALCDLAEMVKFISSSTNSKVFIVGHSQVKIVSCYSVSFALCFLACQLTSTPLVFSGDNHVLGSINSTRYSRDGWSCCSSISNIILGAYYCSTCSKNGLYTFRSGKQQHQFSR